MQLAKCADLLLVNIKLNPACICSDGFKNRVHF